MVVPVPSPGVPHLLEQGDGLGLSARRPGNARPGFEGGEGVGIVRSRAASTRRPAPAPGGRLASRRSSRPPVRHGQVVQGGEVSGGRPRGSSPGRPAPAQQGDGLAPLPDGLEGQGLLGMCERERVSAPSWAWRVARALANSDSALAAWPRARYVRPSRSCSRATTRGSPTASPSSSAAARSSRSPRIARSGRPSFSSARGSRSSKIEPRTSIPSRSGPGASRPSPWPAVRLPAPSARTSPIVVPDDAAHQQPAAMQARREHRPPVAAARTCRRR